jgi:biopolymer transport protein ExbD
MKFVPRTPEEPEINLISLVDVVFMLLIFFMVTTTFVRSSGLKVSLPQAEQSLAQQDAQTIEVVVDAQGRYYIDGRQLRDRSARTLEQGLRQVGGDSARPLVIRADARATHQSVVTVMDVAARSGISQLSITTTPSGVSQ